MLSIVARPDMAPGMCLLSMRSEDPLGFVDTGLSPAVVDPRVYVSVSTIREWAGMLGMVDGKDVQALEDRIADLEAQMAEYDRELDAISVLKARGYEPTRRPGRPKAAA